MPLRVYSFMQYLTAKVKEMRPRDYKALSIVKAVKGRNPGGLINTIKFNGIDYKFGPNDPEGAIDLWVTWAVGRLKLFAPPKSGFVLVPVPNKSAVIGAQESFPTMKLCNRISDAFGDRSKVAAELWWNEALEPAKENGPRFANQLYQHLVLNESPIRGPRILVDDVLTSGGHLTACAAKLREVDLNPIGAIVCGRTFQHQIDNPFAVPIEELPDYDPIDPWGLGDFDIEDVE